MPVVMQPRFYVLDLPRQSQIADDDRIVRRRIRRRNHGATKGIVTRAPHHIANLVGRLHRRAQVVVVIISHHILNIAVSRLDKQNSCSKSRTRTRSVLRNNLRRAAGIHALVSIERNSLRRFANQVFVGVKVVGALGLR